MRVSNNASGVGFATELGSTRATPPKPDQEQTFEATLGQALGQVNAKNHMANIAVANMLQGTGEVHEAMLALHEAEEAVEITIAVRNKVVQAYQDIMRMAL